MLDSEGAVVAVTNTGPDGKYEFAGLPPGDYIVVETNPSSYPIEVRDYDTTPDGTVVTQTRM